MTSEERSTVKERYLKALEDPSSGITLVTPAHFIEGTVQRRFGKAAAEGALAGGKLTDTQALAQIRHNSGWKAAPNTSIWDLPHMSSIQPKKKSYPPIPPKALADGPVTAMYAPDEAILPAKSSNQNSLSDTTTVSCGDVTKLEKLQNAGFKSSAIWQQDEDIHKNFPQEPGLYAFVVEGEVMYIGSASRSLRTRMRSYQRRQRQGSEKRMHPKVGRVLNGKGNIEVYTLVTNQLAPLNWKNLPVDLLIGLEAGLIRQFDPKWNRRGRQPVIEETLSSE